jgi:hypothetical protein
LVELRGTFVGTAEDLTAIMASKHPAFGKWHILVARVMVITMIWLLPANAEEKDLSMLRSSSGQLRSNSGGTTPTVVTAESYGRARIGPYLVLNNFWGLRHLLKVIPDAEWSQAVGFTAKADGSLRGRIEWDWPVGVKDPEVKGYPEVIYGTQPSSKGEFDHAETPLPLRLSQLKVAQSRYDASHRVPEGGMGQLTYDIWLCSSKPARLVGRTHEIMIATAAWGRYGLVDTRNPRLKVPDGVVEIDGRKYQLFYAKEFGTNPGPTRPPWQFIVFQPFEFTAAGEIDLMKFFAVCRERGYITGEEYLAAIEYGVEAVHGRGTVEINDFSVTLK